MGIISRHAGAPFQDGETLAGADLEGDFATIYEEFNGNIEAANLADGAVTGAKIGSATIGSANIADGAVVTAKLADSGVTTLKMLDGAASKSEVDSTSAYTNVSASFTQVGATMSHVVGATTRHVAIMCSASYAGLLPTDDTAVITMQRDGLTLGPAEAITAVQGHVVLLTRMYIDKTPTPGATHEYKWLVRSSAGSGRVYYHSIFVFEPRR